MQGLYNIVFGSHPQVEDILKILNLSEEDFGRFRDAFIDKEKGLIIIYTRVGGGNRSGYPEVFEKMSIHPYFISESDDKFDRTYCDFFFKVIPEKLKDVENREKKNWEETCKSWKKDEKNIPDPVKIFMKKFFEEINDTLNK